MSNYFCYYQDLYGVKIWDDGGRKSERIAKEVDVWAAVRLVSILNQEYKGFMYFELRPGEGVENESC